MHHHFGKDYAANFPSRNRPFVMGPRGVSGIMPAIVRMKDPHTYQ